MRRHIPIFMVVLVTAAALAVAALVAPPCQRRAPPRRREAASTSRRVNLTPRQRHPAAAPNVNWAPFSCPCSAASLLRECELPDRCCID